MKTIISWLINLAFIFGATACVAWILYPQIPFMLAWKIVLALWVSKEFYDIKPTWKEKERNENN